MMFDSPRARAPDHAYNLPDLARQVCYVAAPGFSASFSLFSQQSIQIDAIERKKSKQRKMYAANAGAGADELLRERPHSAPTRAKGPDRPRGPSKMSSSFVSRSASHRSVWSSARDPRREFVGAEGKRCRDVVISRSVSHGSVWSSTRALGGLVGAEGKRCSLYVK